MNAQDLEQWARELLAAELEAEGDQSIAIKLRRGDAGMDYSFVAAIRAIAAALRQQPAPVDLEMLNKAYAQGWIAAAEWVAEQHLISDIGSDAYTDERDDRLLSIIDNAGKVECAEPDAWQFLPKGGGDSNWVTVPSPEPWREKGLPVRPLYAHQPAPVASDASMARALEWVRELAKVAPQGAREHLPAIEEAIAAYDPNCGARTVRVVDEAMRENAERYRWLRDSLLTDEWEALANMPEPENAYEFDAAIDLARAQGVQS